MKVLIDNGRIRSIETGLGQVSVQFAAALCSASSHSDLQFQFITHPKFKEFAAFAAKAGAHHIKGKFSLINKIRRVFDKNIFPYYYDGMEHSVRHALHRQHLDIPSRDTTPFVFTVHDMHILDYGKKSRARNLRRMQHSVARANCVTFISQYSRDIAAEHIDFSGKETQVIYNGVNKPSNPKKPEWFRDDMRPFLFSVAQIETHKNYHIMPPVMHYLPGMNLILAGKHKEKGIALLENAITREKMHSRIIVPGMISEGEKAFLLRECEGFVFPSQKEGFGMPVVEAFHFGKPVFCFAKTALLEIGGGGAFYWQNEDAKGMADLIRSNIFLTSDDSLAVARQQWANNFSWDKNVAAYMDTYRRLSAS